MFFGCGTIAFVSFRNLMTLSDQKSRQNTVTSQLLRLSAVAAVVGPPLYIAVTLLHPPGQPANDHAHVFREYAMSRGWVAIHLVQVAALVLCQVGITGLAGSLLRSQKNGGVFALLAIAFAIASIPLAFALQVIDGIALKRAVDIWIVEGGSVGSPSFAAARAIRLLEEAFNAGFGLNVGFAVILAGAAMVRGGGYPRWFGWAGSVIGLAVVIGAIIVAETGFSSAAQIWVLARNPALWIWTMVGGILMWRHLRRFVED